MNGDIQSPNPGWENVYRHNEARRRAREIRRFKIAMYQAMVGSERDLRKKKLLRADGSIDIENFNKALEEENENSQTSKSSNPTGSLPIL